MLIMRHVTNTQEGPASVILVRAWSSELRADASSPPLHVEMSWRRVPSWHGRDGWGTPPVGSESGNSALKSASVQAG